MGRFADIGGFPGRMVPTDYCMYEYGADQYGVVSRCVRVRVRCAWDGILLGDTETPYDVIVDPRTM